MNTTLTFVRNLNLSGRRLVACAAVCLALPMVAAAADERASAAPSGFDARLGQQLREVQARVQQAEWVNPWMPASGAAARASADRHLQSIVAGHTRAQLDRGGWINLWVSGDDYAAGQPLLAVAVGDGVTSPGEPQRSSARVLAAR